MIALVLAGLGVALAWMISGWVGYAVPMWGCAVLVFFGIVLGIRHSALEGIILTGVYLGIGYMILKTMPQVLPIFSGALAGFSTCGIIIGVLAEQEEAPQREAEQRAWEEEHAREEAEWRKRQEDLEERERKLASLPLPIPKAEIRECLEAFRTYLNRVWPRLPPDLFTPNNAGYKLIHNWLQWQFLRIVEKPLGCHLIYTYGDYDMDYDDDLPQKEAPDPEIFQSRPMEIRVNEKYDFHCLVSVRDGWHYTEPPFDHVRVSDDSPTGERYIPFDQARFELHPAR